MMLIDRRLIASFDWALLLLALIVPFVGFINLYSAGFDSGLTRAVSFGPWELYNLVLPRQILFWFMGLVLMVVVLCLPPTIFLRCAYIFYGLGIVSLVLVLTHGIVVNGSRRWIGLGGIRVQPAEFMKLGMLLALARYLAKHPPHVGGYGIRGLIIPLILIIAPMLLVMRQPDLGSAISVGIVGIAMVLFMGVRTKLLVGTILVGLVALYPAWTLLHPYQQQRLATLINPDADPRGSGYHIIQSKIAVGSGELLGKGYLRGTQTQLAFLPEHTTDFIFSVLAEEWGFLGCSVVLILYSILLYRLLRVGFRSRDLTGCLIAVGTASMIFFNTAINAGMVMGLFPIVGIPMPLMSYGGSSVLTTLIAIGFTLGVSMRRGTVIRR